MNNLKVYLFYSTFIHKNMIINIIKIISRAKYCDFTIFNTIEEMFRVNIKLEIKISIFLINKTKFSSKTFNPISTSNILISNHSPESII